MNEIKQSKWRMLWLEFKDMMAGTAFPLMLALIVSVAFIGLVPSITTDKALCIVLLCVGEVGLAVAYVIFGRQSGITSVRKLVQHAKKREANRADEQTEYGTGEYSAYKGFLMGFFSCVPYMVFQIIQALAPNSFCEFVLSYVFGWAVYPFEYAGLNQWLNLLWVLFPTIVHGVAYIVGAHLEWNKQQKVANLQKVGVKSEEETEEE